LHLVAPDQEGPHALVDMIVDRSVGHQACAVVEVRTFPKNSGEAECELG